MGWVVVFVCWGFFFLPGFFCWETVCNLCSQRTCCYVKTYLLQGVKRWFLVRIQSARQTGWSLKCVGVAGERSAQPDCVKQMLEALRKVVLR